MTVRASRIIRGIVMIPVTDDASGKNQQRQQRYRNTENADCLSQCQCLKPTPVREPLGYYFDVMWT